MALMMRVLFVCVLYLLFLGGGGGNGGIVSATMKLAGDVPIALNADNVGNEGVLSVENTATGDLNVNKRLSVDGGVTTDVLREQSGGVGVSVPNNVHVTGSMTVTGTVDGEDVSDLGDAHRALQTATDANFATVIADIANVDGDVANVYARTDVTTSSRASQASVDSNFATVLSNIANVDGDVANVYARTDATTSSRATQTSVNALQTSINALPTSCVSSCPACNCGSCPACPACNCGASGGGVGWSIVALDGTTKVGELFDYTDINVCTTWQIKTTGVGAPISLTAEECGTGTLPGVAASQVPRRFFAGTNCLSSWAYLDWEYPSGQIRHQPWQGDMVIAGGTYAVNACSYLPAGSNNYGQCVNIPCQAATGRLTSPYYFGPCLTNRYSMGGSACQLKL